MDKFKQINLFHIFVVSLLFLYVGLMKNELYSWLYSILFLLGIIVTFYHISAAYKQIAPLWIHILHFLIIGPLLIYIGFNGKETHRMYYEILLLLGFAALGYHGLNFIRY